MTLAGPPPRRIAFLRRAARAGNAAPGLVWLPGFKSDMHSSKAGALDQWAQEQGRALLRFDYSGHGLSGGDFVDGTISRWLEETLALIRGQTSGPQVIVGSSMGGWLALLAARALASSGETARLHALVLIAPAVDFTEALIWQKLPPAARQQIEETGHWNRPSQYGDAYPITRELLEDGRRHLLLGAPVRTHCRVHVLHGMQDPDVPWQHGLRLVEHLASDDAVFTLVRDGEHRLSRPQDIALLLRIIEGVD